MRGVSRAAGNQRPRVGQGNPRAADQNQGHRQRAPPRHRRHRAASGALSRHARRLLHRIAAGLRPRARQGRIFRNSPPTSIICVVSAPPGTLASSQGKQITKRSARGSTTTYPRMVSIGVDGRQRAQHRSTHTRAISPHCSAQHAALPITAAGAGHTRRRTEILGNPVDEATFQSDVTVQNPMSPLHQFQAPPGDAS